MDELVSGIARRSGVFRFKNENDGQRVKRRRVKRKLQFDGGSVAKAIGPAAARMIFENFTGTVWAQNDGAP
jgi:hypothetical protein